MTRRLTVSVPNGTGMTIVEGQPYPVFGEDKMVSKIDQIGSNSYMVLFPDGNCKVWEGDNVVSTEGF